MFGKKKLDLSKLNSIIAKGMIVSGSVTFEGTMKISGEMKGSSIKPNDSDSASPPSETILIVEGKVTCAIKKDFVKCYCLTIFETRLPDHSDNSFVELPKFDSSWEKQMMGGADADEANEFYSVFVDIRSK